MFFFLVHLVMRRLLRVVAGSSAVAALEVENAVLRHQLVVLRRTVRRPRLRRRDRLLLAAASALLPRDRWSVLLVSPQTLLRWQRELVRKKWSYRRRLPGRPPLDVTHYNAERPHRALALAAPIRGSHQARGSPSSEIRRRDVLGGLIHEYYAAAA